MSPDAPLRLPPPRPPPRDATGGRHRRATSIRPGGVGVDPGGVGVEPRVAAPPRREDPRDEIGLAPTHVLAPGSEEGF